MAAWGVEFDPDQRHTLQFMWQNLQPPYDFWALELVLTKGLTMVAAAAAIAVPAWLAAIRGRRPAPPGSVG